MSISNTGLFWNHLNTAELEDFTLELSFEKRITLTNYKNALSNDWNPMQHRC